MRSINAEKRTPVGKKRMRALKINITKKVGFKTWKWKPYHKTKYDNQKTSLRAVSTSAVKYCISKNTLYQKKTCDKANECVLSFIQSKNDRI